ncbi:hypothetical protein KH5_04540 [Urechidicola sp. KH5]
MKRAFLKAGLFLAVLTFIACDETDTPTEISEPVSTEDISAIEAIDIAVEEVNIQVEQAYLEEEEPLVTTRGGGNDFFPECLTKTVVRTNNSKIITLDFGDGCEVRGHFIAGVLIMEYNKNREEQTKTITVTYDGYRIDNKLIEGAQSILREKENQNGNPQSTADFDIMVTWDNGDTASRVGNKVREWIEGVGSGNWGDNVYEITGNWTTVRRNGTIITGEVIVPLRRELSCRFLVSGEIALTKNNRSGILNYGQGECDNMATLTLDDGTVVEITLG